MVYCWLKLKFNQTGGWEGKPFEVRRGGKKDAYLKPGGGKVCLCVFLCLMCMYGCERWQKKKKEKPSLFLFFFFLLLFLFVSFSFSFFCCFLFSFLSIHIFHKLKKKFFSDIKTTWFLKKYFGFKKVICANPI